VAHTCPPHRLKVFGTSGLEWTRERERDRGGGERERERGEREREEERERDRARARAREHVMCGNGLDNMTRCTPQKGFGSRV